MHTVYIALGSNLGDRRVAIDGAITALRDDRNITVPRISAWIETEPVGGPPGQSNYLNGAAELQTELSPRELLRVLNRIERQFGRVRNETGGPRTLDLDLLLYDDLVIHEADLIVPHPRMTQRLFVLEPLAEIAPHFIHPTEKASIQALLAALTPGL